MMRDVREALRGVESQAGEMHREREMRTRERRLQESNIEVNWELGAERATGGSRFFLFLLLLDLLSVRRNWLI
jgi:hypothetical protein